MRTADIYIFGKLAGALTEKDDGNFSNCRPRIIRGLSRARF